MAAHPISSLPSRSTSARPCRVQRPARAPSRTRRMPRGPVQASVQPAEVGLPQAEESELGLAPPAGAEHPMIRNSVSHQAWRPRERLDEATGPHGHRLARAPAEAGRRPAAPARRPDPQRPTDRRTGAPIRRAISSWNRSGAATPPRAPTRIAPARTVPASRAAAATDAGAGDPGARRSRLPAGERNHACLRSTRPDRGAQEAPARGRASTSSTQRRTLSKLSGPRITVAAPSASAAATASG